jgi:hypothetical protein
MHSWNVNFVSQKYFHVSCILYLVLFSCFAESMLNHVSRFSIKSNKIKLIKRQWIGGADSAVLVVGCSSCFIKTFNIFNTYRTRLSVLCCVIYRTRVAAVFSGKWVYAKLRCNTLLIAWSSTSVWLVVRPWTVNYLRAPSRSSIGSLYYLSVQRILISTVGFEGIDCNIARTTKDVLAGNPYRCAQNWLLGLKKNFAKLVYCVEQQVICLWIVRQSWE